MKNLFILLVLLMTLAMIPILAHTQTPSMPSSGSPISQPLIREGMLAVKLAEDLKLGTTDNEAEAEDLLSSVGIMPQNGWIADYPVTPDIVGELEADITAAANGGRIHLSANDALQALQNDVSSYGLPLVPDTSGNYAGDASAPSYPDSAAANDYYYNDGPPTVTYYDPPPDYAYLYDWVPYPFWWSNYWFPGFFVLTDFHVKTHWHHHGHEHEGFVSNHVHDPKTGIVARVDPANRSRGGTFPAGGRTVWSNPAARSGAQAVYDRSRGLTEPPPRREFRGYGAPPPSREGTRTSAFEHSVNRQVEHASSDRGFQSRSRAGQMPAAVRGGAAAPHSGGGGAPHGGTSGGGAPHGGTSGGGTPHGGGSGGGFHGGGRR